MEFEESPGEIQRLTISKIEEMADMYFPIRDKDNKPSYREHQRETIIKIAKAFYIDDKKFVAVDGPVGCGKSAINYTIARMSGDTVYLTPLKMLQDQIVSENWEGVKMLKGRGAYACNFCGYDNDDYRCNYAGDKFDTCQTSRIKNNFTADTIETVGRRVEEVHKSLGHNKFAIRLRSSFSSPEEYWNSIEDIKKFTLEEKKKYAVRSGQDPNKVRYDHDFEKNVACVMDAVHECPANSSRLLAKMAPIRVLNPDIFFLLNRAGSPYYSHNDLMVYDECQQIEGVISRIFKVKLPIDTLYNMFGIDMRRLYEFDEMGGLLKETGEFIFKTLGPLTAAAKTINRLGDICSVRNYPTLDRMKTKNSIAVKLIECAHGFLFNKWRKDANWSFSILNIINHAFTGNKLPEEFECFGLFIRSINEYFTSCCFNYGCDLSVDIFKDLVPACKKRVDSNTLNRLRRVKTKDLTLIEKNDYEIGSALISEDRVFADLICVFKKFVEPFITNMNALSSVKDDDLPAFTVAKLKEPAHKALRDGPLSKEISNSPYANRPERCLEVVPIAIGRLMHAFFYSRARKVLLTSGTWVAPDSLFKLYGLHEDKMEFIKIPSTFNPESRKIFVVDNKSFTNFSEKESNYGGSYIYKTEEGTKKFTLELSSIVKRVRRYIKDNHDKNANIIIHSYTFHIAKSIAEYAPDVDGSYLIHLPNPGSQIQNKKTNHIVWARDKNDLIQTMKDCPNQGLTIVSPSITEGVDFKGDICRAQIILKRPIPYLGDIYVKSFYKGNVDVGVERDPDFLDRVCYTTMTQMYGRIVRSVDDWGFTICLDQSITWALKGLAKHRRRINDLNINYFCDGVQVNMVNGKAVFPWIFG